jgi:hypothetical protein
MELNDMIKIALILIFLLILYKTIKMLQKK